MERPGGRVLFSEQRSGLGRCPSTQRCPVSGINQSPALRATPAMTLSPAPPSLLRCRRVRNAQRLSLGEPERRGLLSPDRAADSACFFFFSFSTLAGQGTGSPASLSSSFRGMGGTGGEWSRLPPGTAAGAARPRWGVGRAARPEPRSCQGVAHQVAKAHDSLLGRPRPRDRSSAPWHREGDAPRLEHPSPPRAGPGPAGPPGPICCPPSRTPAPRNGNALQPVGLSSLGPDTWGPHEAWSAAQGARWRTITRGREDSPARLLPAPQLPASPGQENA